MKNWLISNADLRLISNDYEFDWTIDKLFSNGIISPEDAYWKMYCMRFEYADNLDCPFCKAIDKHYALNNELWKCKNCAKNFTITSRTYIDNTKLEYYHWVRFGYLIGELKITNSCVIAKDLDITQKTAWNMIETLRIARKETSNKKFVNGNEVLTFKHIYEPLKLLMKLKLK